MFDISVHGRKNKNCATKFIRCNCFPNISTEEIVHYSKEKITCKILAFFTVTYEARGNMTLLAEKKGVLFRNLPWKGLTQEISGHRGS